ncbi:hypothetical protein HYC85_019828 [Camellia sinensis]|uniref:tRNA-dihydrouridine(47) synthase [NAD(P)(+)] n=1 Tax=Camellia sinensis TaxID=4442 RepID=A0A7J7GRR6_CAMSI|nr:hypothetical protein HYC85_019828 [Camellia sinensis]
MCHLKFVFESVDRLKVISKFNLLQLGDSISDSFGDFEVLSRFQSSVIQSQIRPARRVSTIIYQDIWQCGHCLSAIGTYLFILSASKSCYHSFTEKEQSALRAQSSSVRSSKSQAKITEESVPKTVKFQPFIQEEALVRCFPKYSKYNTTELSVIESVFKLRDGDVGISGDGYRWRKYGQKMGQASEWALLRRHSSEELFGVQICGAYPDTVARIVELIDQECTVDFIDINMGCPIDIVVNKGAGSALLTKPTRMKSILQAAFGTIDRPITVKVRTGYLEGKNRIDLLIEDIGKWGANAVTIHGRSCQQRYSKLADWEYITSVQERLPMLCKSWGMPWIFTEIKEQRHWDISSGERLNILKEYVRFGLDHWGSDAKGI